MRLEIWFPNVTIDNTANNFISAILFSLCFVVKILLHYPWIFCYDDNLWFARARVKRYAFIIVNGSGMRRECRERFPRRRLQRKLIVSDPGMHHGTCDTSESHTRCDGETFPAFLAYAQPEILRISQEAHDTMRHQTWCHNHQALWGKFRYATRPVIKNSESRENGCCNANIALKYDRRLGSNACQISKRLDNSKHRSRAFVTLRYLTRWHHMQHWNASW